MFNYYKNGNYTVGIDAETGTKIRFNKENYMRADRPESIDLKISNMCNMGCPMCHEQSTPDVALADLNHPLFDSAPEWCELALGGGNVFTHPYLVPFLQRMRDKHVICNITVHLQHFKDYHSIILQLQNAKLIHGVGVSVNEPISEEDIDLIAATPNAVVHTIAGIMTVNSLMLMANKGLKLLILGYKMYGRGAGYAATNGMLIRMHIDSLARALPRLRNYFKLISFDNLAVKQLNVKNIVSEEEYDTFYMGDDATATFYIDAVKMEYAPSSTSARRPIDSDNITELFNRIRI